MEWRRVWLVARFAMPDSRTAFLTARWTTVSCR